MRNLVLFTLGAVLLGALAIPARAFTHPCIPTTLQELDTIKANLDKEPWKSGFAALAADAKSQLGWVQEGPFAEVKRNPNLNLTAWSHDMGAVYNLARMWYFTGNEAYAQKARDILISWATTQTSFGGNEAGLALGDVALAYAGGASILRGTWPGWTESDTITVKNYFLNVFWPSTANPWKVVGPANKGAINMAAGIAIAAFCDDTERFNLVLDIYRTYPGSGLSNILPTGQMGETGRDAGHAYGALYGKAFVAEVAWKQGIDLFSESDNRLLACGEYYARNTFIFDNPFVPYGTVDYHYWENAEGPYGANRAALLILQNAYKNRRNVPTPWIDRKLQEQHVDGYNWMYAKTADLTTATAPAAVVRPAVSLASSGLTLTTLGSQTAGRSSSYSNGVWTVTGLGGGTWTNGADDCQFVYRQMTGDCAMVARVTSNQWQAGLMIRDNLVGTVSKRAWVGILNSSPAKLEGHNRGWYATWAGIGWAQRSQELVPGLPYWLKIERRNDIITTYASQDGTSWAPVVSSDYAGMPSTACVGLFVARTGTANTVTFDNVAFTGGTGGLVTTPVAPAALFATGSSKAISVRWLPSFGATSYDLLRSTTSGSGYTVIASDLTASKTSYVDTAVTAGTTYYYVARAKNSVGTSGDSPEFYASLLAGVPMANLAFSGTASDSGNSSAANSASGFDQNPGSLWFHNGTTGWLQYDFGAGNAQVVKRYTVQSAGVNIPARDPKDWQFLGSNDGTSWTTLDSQSEQAFANRYQQNTYHLGNTTAYRYYRLNITANNGDTTFTHLGDVGLWSDTGRTIPNGRYRLVSRHSNKVMDVAGLADGAQVVQQTFDGDNSQEWNIEWQGNGQFQATNTAGARVLDNGSSSAGANLVIQPSSGGASQLWKIVPDSDGFFHLTSESSGLVANVAGGSTADGAGIVQSSYSGDDPQLWMPGLAAAAQPIPPVPAGLAATPVSISQINLSWTASPGAISYNLKRATASGGPYTTVAAGINTTSYQDTYLTSATTYYYVVSAVNGSGESAHSAQAQATTLTGPPPAPTGLTAILGTSRAILNWTATGGATSYTVKRATASGGPYTTIAAGVTSPSYTDTGRTTDVASYYVVVAINAHGSSPDSAEVAVGPGTLSIHLAFDETGGATAADSSGRANDATLVNGPTFAAGFLARALELPATSSQYARLPSGIVSGLTDFTIATWIKVDAFATWARIFDFGTGTNNHMFLAAQGSAGAGRPRFSIRTPSGGEQVIDSSIALTAGTWAHIAVTRSGNTNRLYINGALAGTATITINPSDLGVTTQNALGKSQYADPYLNAALDDFRLYAHAMSQAEITALAHPPAGAPTQPAAAAGDGEVTLTWLPDATTTHTVKRSTTSGGPYTIIAEGVTDTTYTDTGLTNGVSYYYVVSGANADGSGPDSAEVSSTPTPLRLDLSFDETSGATAADSSGRAQHATLVNGPTFGTGKIGNALVLDAASFQHAKLPSGIVSDLTDFTVSTWIKVNAFATWQRIFDFGTGTTNYMFLTTQYAATAPNNAKLRFGIRTPTAAEQSVSGTDIALVAGTWTHVAVTRSGDTVRLYVNGSLAGSGTITLSPSALGVTTQNYLGKSQFNDPYLNGALDDFRLYSYAFDAAEIAAVVGGPPATPASLTATPNGSAAVTLSWSAVADATSYRVKRSATSGGPYSAIATGVSGTGYSDTGLAAATTFYYAVSAVNAAGESADSSPASATTAASGDSPGAGPTPATVTLGNLAQIYDGTTKPVGITTTPAGLSTTVTYNGSADEPVNAGSYTVVATVSNDNYTGSATGTLVIAKAPQVLSFPTPADRVVGDAPFSLNASASSGLPVTFTLTSGPATLSGSTVTLTGETGTVSVAASQPGNANYEAASTMTRSFAVLAAGETTVAGVYLGTFAGGSGTDGFGLLVRADGTATFAGSVAGTSLVADNLTLDSGGSFTAVVKPLGETMTVTLSGQVLDGVVTGTLSRGNPAFSGSRSAAVGEGAYWISHVGTAGGDSVAIVDADGRAYVVSHDGAAASGAFAALDGGGNLVATLPDGSTLTLSLTSGSGTLTRSGVTTVLSGVSEAQRLYPRLVNASTRGLTAAGENVLITGFVVSGSSSKRVLIRVAGPSLEKFGVTSPLADPRLRLFRGGATLLDNDNWSAADAADIASTGAFPFANGSRDAAVIAVLEPGPYTVHALPGATSQANADGVVLTELYELRQSDEAPGARRLVNLSTRGRVTTEPLIIGFVIDGPAARRVLVRAAGPALRAHGVTTALANPRLRLFSGSNAIRENDDWSAGADATKVAAAFEATGAFAFTDGAKDAALLVSLQPGPYTAHVESVDGTSGVALVEVYELR